MKDTLFNIICKGIITICVIICSCTFIHMGNQLNKVTELNKQFERYNNLIEQYDTTTSYNRIVIYPQIMELSDSIKNTK